MKKTKIPAGRSPGARHGVALSSAIRGVALCVLLGSQAMAGPAEQAERMYNRIAGVPAPPDVLSTMTTDIQNGNPQAAAALAVQAPTFYNVVLKNMVIPWTNRAQTVFAPLNDFAATYIGMVRDNGDFSTILSADILYVGPTSGNIPAPSISNNNHYAALEANGIDLSSALTQTTQSATYGTQAPAGLFTTYGAASAFFINGTNRAMFRFTMMNMLCNDMSVVTDITRPPDRIRRDVARSPGGDSRTFLNQCIGCHSGMDPMAQAFAYYNFDATQNTLVYTAGQVQAKYAINTTNFPFGYQTPDDHWTNYWRQGPNMALGWNPALPGSGNGAASMGAELAGSDAFAQCQVTNAFQTVCFRAPGNAADYAQVSTMKSTFKTNHYQMKPVFEQAAVYCMGQ
jgi:hypothetical protein